MLALKKTIPKAYAQLSRPCIQFTQTRWNSNTPVDTEKTETTERTAQIDGILNVLGMSKTEGEENGSFVEKANNNNKMGGFNINLFATTIQSLGQTPHQLHIHASPNNTIITLTRPNGAPLVTTSGGSAGFKKAARSGYEAAHQAALQLLEKMNAKNLQVPNVHIVLKGFGPGRDAAFKALVSGNTWNVKRITDATPIPFGGCRPKKARRL